MFLFGLAHPEPQAITPLFRMTTLESWLIHLEYHLRNKLTFLYSCNGHGTHVTGIIAVQPNNPFNITGVAYKSSIRMYRVFGCTGVVADPYVAGLRPTILCNFLLGSSFLRYLKHTTMATMLSICRSSVGNRAYFAYLLCPFEVSWWCRRVE